MEITEAIRTALKELIVPELDRIKEENTEIKTILSLTNKRLDDMTAYLVDQSRRIDTLREELANRIDTLREEFTKRIDALREEFNRHIDTLQEGVTRHTDTLREEFTKSIEGVRTEIALKFGEIATRMDRLYEVIVRRDEYIRVEERVAALERVLLGGWYPVERKAQTSFRPRLVYSRNSRSA